MVCRIRPSSQNHRQLELQEFLTNAAGQTHPVMSSDVGVPTFTEVARCPTRETDGAGEAGGTETQVRFPRKSGVRARASAQLDGHSPGRLQLTHEESEAQGRSCHKAPRSPKCFKPHLPASPPRTLTCTLDPSRGEHLGSLLSSLQLRPGHLPSRLLALTSPLHGGNNREEKAHLPGAVTE